MKNQVSITLALVFGVISLAHANPQSVPRNEPPNIVFILVDDQGWTDLSSQTDSKVAESKSDYYETPNIDKLASRSFRFSSGYAPSPICTPSRASILTGKSPQMLGFTDILESRPGSRRFSDLYAGKKMIGPLPVMGFPDSETTYAEYIRQNVPEDYALAHFGKWHVGGGDLGATALRRMMAVPEITT